MSEMVERVARDIHASYVQHAVGYPGAKSWDELSVFEREFGRRLAHAAIAAMREPTSAVGRRASLGARVEFAGASCFAPDCPTVAFTPNVVAIWQAMIDAALAEDGK